MSFVVFVASLHKNTSTHPRTLSRCASKLHTSRNNNCLWVCYPRRLCRSAWVRRLRPSVCLFVCLFVSSITQKRKWSHCVQTWYKEWCWDILEGYTRSDMVWELKGQRSRSQDQLVHFQPTTALHWHWRHQSSPASRRYMYIHCEP